jgi:2',3'-cyclic-nucleotide 2'-phosphodiesterase (5'-nucleotidase family)
MRSTYVKPCIGILLQVSGLTYEFDPNDEPWNRVKTVKVGDNDLDPEKRYTVACRSRLGFGQGELSCRIFNETALI